MSESIGSQFFAIHELLLLVLSYLSPPGKSTVSSIDSKSLAALARVSRSISDAALDSLWRTIHQPGPIIRLLPADAWQLTWEVKETWDEDHTPSEQEYRLLRPLTPDDFAAFDKYAPRVRFVDLTNSSRLLGRGCELLPYIKKFRNPILPALVYFRWEASSLSRSIGALHLLSREAAVPSEELSLLMWGEIEHIPGESEVIANTIDAFNDPALPWLPDVKTLTLRTLHFLPALRMAIPRLSNLEHFSCDLCIDRSLFQSLASLPRLRFVDFRSLPAEAVASLPTDSPSFDALEGLRISGTLSSIHALLPRISSPGLSSVHLVAKDFQSLPVESTLLSLLPPTIRTRVSTLQHFRFAGPPPSARAHSLDRLVLAAFAPLYGCRALQTFCVDIDALRLVFTDNDVHTMAHAWPSLTTLIVTPPRSAWQPALDVHLYSLWAFAVDCPRLRRLELEVDADVVAPFRVEDGAVISPDRSSMEDMTLFCSPCGDPALVGEFLNRAFPRLMPEAFHAYASKGRPQDRERWAAVTASMGNPIGEISM